MARVNFAGQKNAVKNCENRKTLYKNDAKSGKNQVIIGQKVGQ